MWFNFSDSLSFVTTHVHVFVCRQEEYEGEDEVGKLRCGHKYHIDCARQWLLRKNSCPVCKTMPFA